MSLYTLHEKTQSRDLFYMKSNAWKYVWMIEKTPVDPRLYNNILWGLKALGDKPAVFSSGSIVKSLKVNSILYSLLNDYFKGITWSLLL